MTSGPLLAEALRFVGARSGRVLAGLNDDEFFWEPVAGCWTIRRRQPGEVQGSPSCTGRGDYVLDDAAEDPDPPPFTTIAWRIGHLVLINEMFSNHLLGPGGLGFDDIEMPGSAEEGVASWRESYGRFTEQLSEVADLTPEVQVPWGAQKSQSLWHWTLVLMHENIHHLAESGVVRNLYRHHA